eukprot:COSAG06_NODE_4165_length_4508_cov_8.097026_4_plen_75_part_00
MGVLYLALGEPLGEVVVAFGSSTSCHAMKAHAADRQAELQRVPAAQTESELYLIQVQMQSNLNLAHINPHLYID